MSNSEDKWHPKQLWPNRVEFLLKLIKTPIFQLIYQDAVDEFMERREE